MTNPFSIEPGNNFLPGLSMLNQSIQQYGAKKKEDELKAKFETIKAGAVKAYQSGDPDQMAQFALENPEISQALMGMMQFKNNITKDNYIDSVYGFLADPTEENLIKQQEKRLKVLESQGQTNTTETTAIIDKFRQNPEQVVNQLKMTVAPLDPKRWEAFKESTQPTIKPTGEIQNFEYYQNLLKDDELGAATFQKMIGKGGGDYAPTTLKKLIGERKALVEGGMEEDDPVIKAYDNKIAGSDIDMENISQDEIDTWGAWTNLTGKTPSLGMGKDAAKLRVKILKSAAQQALGSKQFGEEDTQPDKTPAQAALDMIGTQADTKSIQQAQNFLEKQLSSMGSFVSNMEAQIDKVKELSKDLETYDTRLLNVPLRAVRGKIKGSAEQAKYDMYLTEIESEIGKLATGSSASISELSVSAQEKWDRIHDKNLSIKDMLSLLEETKAAARLRVQSVQTQLDLTRDKMKNRTGSTVPTGQNGGMFKEGQTATGPNGEKIIFRNGKWSGM